MVTAPVQKSVINEAGIAFTGHTEYLAERTQGRPTGDAARERLAARGARHDPPASEGRAAGASPSSCCARPAPCWRASSSAPSASPRPAIAVCGVNPHAGEGGYLGDEEVRIIAPAMARLQGRGHPRQRPAAGRHGVRAAGARTASTPCSPCTTTRGCRCVKHAGFAHRGERDARPARCCAPRPITAPRSTSPAAAAPTAAACGPRCIWRASSPRGGC